MSEYLDYLSQFDVYSLDDVQEDAACLTEPNYEEYQYTIDEELCEN